MTLTDFDGLPVRQTSLALRGAGDGLSEAMKTDPREFHHGETFFILYEAVVEKVRYDQIDKEDPELGLSRVHMAKAMTATLVDEAFAGESIRAQKILNEKAKDEEAGAKRLPGTVPELEDEYDDGLDDFDAEAEPKRLTVVDDGTVEG